MKRGKKENMADGEIPLRKDPARVFGAGARRGQGTLLLYSDKLAHVRSQAAGWAGSVGFAVIAIASFALAHGGPGALGGAIGAGGGWMIGAAIAKSQAAGKVAAGGDRVTVIPLDSIASLQTVKSAGIAGRLGGQSLLVTTADRAQYRFGVKLDKWSADLASALTARGRDVRTTREGMAITPVPNARRNP
jgi:hypothetical protein